MKATHLGLAAAALCAAGCATNTQPEVRKITSDSHYQMYLVTRIWSDDLMARFDGVTEEEEKAHQEHIEGYSRTAVSSNVYGADGKPIGVIALNAFESREGVEYYIYEDPYTKAGFYKEISIVPVEVSFIDEYFRIEPDWIRGEGLATKHRRYERDNISPVSDAAAREPR
jgi:uncharacterized protein YciI